MSIIIVDEDGQSFVSPPELDAFTYYRDYVLKRTFKEFFTLNPGTAKGGWVPILGQAYWFLDYTSGSKTEIVWEGDNIVCNDSYSFRLKAVNRDWPDSPPELSWTRYLRPTRIRFTIKDKDGNLTTRVMLEMWFDGDDEFMESIELGTPEGFIFAWDPTIPVVGDNDYIWYFYITTLLPGDRITNLEFNYDPLPQFDYTNHWRSTPEAPNDPDYLITSNQSNGYPILLLVHGTLNRYHTIWNGASWDTYYLPVYSAFQGNTDGIAMDDFGEVHYFYRNNTPVSGNYRTSWNVIEGWHEQDVLYSTDQKWNPDYGVHSIIDLDGYAHYFYIQRTDSPEYRYYIGHYWQNEFGWQTEEIFNLGEGNDGPYQQSQNTCLNCQVDSYNRLHIFISTHFRVDTWDHRPFVLYLTNSRSGSWEYEELDIFPDVGDEWGNYSNIWVDRDNDNYMTGIAVCEGDPGLIFLEKTWLATNWTTYDLGFNDPSIYMSAKYNNKIAMLGNREGQGLHMRVMEYFEYNTDIHILEKSELYGYQWAEYSGSFLDVRRAELVVKDGVFNFLYPGSQVGFVEMEITE